MAKKEELYKLAEELAKGCNNLISRKVSTADEEEELARDFFIIAGASRLIGFLEALVCVGIFDEEDKKRITSIAFPKKNSPATLHPNIVNFINSLEGLNTLGSENSG